MNSRRIINADTVLNFIKNSRRHCHSSHSISRALNGALDTYQVADGLRELQRQALIEKYNRRSWILKK